MSLKFVPCLLATMVQFFWSRRARFPTDVVQILVGNNTCTMSPQTLTWSQLRESWSRFRKHAPVQHRKAQGSTRRLASNPSGCQIACSSCHDQFADYTALTKVKYMGAEHLDESGLQTVNHAPWGRTPFQGQSHHSVRSPCLAERPGMSL